MIPQPSEQDGLDVHQRYEVIKSGKSEGIDGNPYYGYEESLDEKVVQSFSEFGIEIEDHNIYLIKGLYQDTLTIDSPVSFAHIDCDWYESVLVCLQQIEPHLVKGGTLVIDDYFVHSGCRKAVDEYFDTKNKNDYQFVTKNRLQIVKKS